MHGETPFTAAFAPAFAVTDGACHQLTSASRSLTFRFRRRWADLLAGQSHTYIFNAGGPPLKGALRGEPNTICICRERAWEAAFHLGSQDCIYEGDLCNSSRLVYGQLQSNFANNVLSLVLLSECK